MSDNDTFQFLNQLLQFGWRLGLENITTLLAEMGNPHLRFKSVHIAGTNGKGSTAAMIESMYRKAGYKTGLYTSPHLLEVEERIKSNGEKIAKSKLAHYLEQNRERISGIGCTYFEALTAVAFQYFADEQVELAVIEVGLGGRFDATNVITPLLSVITEIDLDHTEHLGRTITQIAKEKAGIVKSLAPCLSGATQNSVNKTIRDKCIELNAPFYPAEEMSQAKIIRIAEEGSEFDLIFHQRVFHNLATNLAGHHQLRNATLAVAATEILREQNFFLDENAVRDGLRSVNWPARLQKLQDSPKVVIDVAHNPAGMKVLLRSLREVFQFDRLIMVIGLLGDKDYKTISRMIARNADVIVITRPNSDRALSVEKFGQEVASRTGKYAIRPAIADAYNEAVAQTGTGDLICVTGSHYVVGEFLKFYKKA